MSMLSIIAASRRRALTYSQEVLADGPLRYYRLYETSGTTANDETNTANGTHGTGVTVGATGPILRAARYDGTANGNTSIANASDLRSWGDFTIEQWVSVLTWPSGSDLAYTCAHYNPGANRRAWGVNLRGPSAALASDVLALLLSTNGTGFTLTLPIARTSIGVNTWRHVVHVRSGSSLTAYVDGASVETDSFSGALFTNSTDAVLLGSAAGVSPGNVELADVALYNKALSAARIAAHYAARTRP